MPSFIVPSALPHLSFFSNESPPPAPDVLCVCLTLTFLSLFCLPESEPLTNHVVTSRCSSNSVCLGSHPWQRSYLDSIPLSLMQTATPSPTYLCILTAHAHQSNLIKTCCGLVNQLPQSATVMSTDGKHHRFVGSLKETSRHVCYTPNISEIMSVSSVSCSPGKVGTPMSSSAAATPTVSHLSHFSSGEVLAQTCRALLDHTQSLAPSLQSQPVGEEVRVHSHVPSPVTSPSIACSSPRRVLAETAASAAETASLFLHQLTEHQCSGPTPLIPLSLCVPEIVSCSWHFPHHCLLLARQWRSRSTLTSLSRWRELSNTRGRKVSPLMFALHLPAPPLLQFTGPPQQCV